MRLIEKILVGGLLVGAINAAMCVGGAGIVGQERGKLEKQADAIIQANEYEKANAENKQKQIAQIIEDYNNGIITAEELSKRTADKNIKELDVDIFAKENLSKEDYEEYLNLKAQIEEKII